MGSLRAIKELFPKRRGYGEAHIKKWDVETKDNKCRIIYRQKYRRWEFLKKNKVEERIGYECFRCNEVMVGSPRIKSIEKNGVKIGYEAECTNCNKPLYKIIPEMGSIN